VIGSGGVGILGGFGGEDSQNGRGGGKKEAPSRQPQHDGVYEAPGRHSASQSPATPLGRVVCKAEAEGEEDPNKSTASVQRNKA
jgi:hypothetical protein